VTRLVQIQHGSTRRVALVDEPHLRLLRRVESVLELANRAIAESISLTALIEREVTIERLDYDSVYAGASAWRLLVPIDHPEPARCLVSGTGLTHIGSAASRNAMHGKSDSELTDSMRMFRSGLEGGRPVQGCVGTAPEWFYKGTGTLLKATGDPLLVPGYADDGGEEAEVAGIYVVDPDGQPRRVGMAAGNEFSDHKLERTNYLNLAASKLRNCSLGPELVIDPDFDDVPGHVAIERLAKVIWERDVTTGEREMCHSVANIEHHHFKFEGNRRPGDVHIHYFGAHSLSYADDLRLVDGDVMTIRFAGFGRALRNPLKIAQPIREPIAARPLV
jgi:hypothetical protein